MMRKIAAIVGMSLASACYGQTDAGGGNAGDWPVVAPPATPEIPPFPDLCSRYQLEVVAVEGFSQGPTISCPCGDASVCDLFGAIQHPGSVMCLSSLDCGAYCQALSQGVSPNPAACFGSCTGDQDCSGLKCVELPGGQGGSCMLTPNEWCLDDSDCDPGVHCVAVSEDGVRKCARGGAQCNSSDDCADGTRCALPVGSFVGSCADGTEGLLCYRDSDCRVGLHCALGVFGPGVGSCTSGASFALCGTDGDCDGGKCLSSHCSTGLVGNNCSAQVGCQPGLQCVNQGIESEPDLAVCSDGSPGSDCMQSSQCAPGLYCTHGLCADGSNHSYCDEDAQCQSHRCQVGGNEVCTSGEPGAACFDAGDCSSESCSRAAGAFEWESGICD